MQTLEAWGESQGYIRLISQKSGLKPGFVALIFAIVAVLIVYQGIVGGFVMFFFGVVLPAYQSFKAIESSNKDDDTRMLHYWCVFSLAFAFDGFLQPILDFVPLIGIFRFVLIIVLTMNNFAFSSMAYNFIVSPILKKYERDIDSAYENAESAVGKLAESAKDKLKANVGKVGAAVGELAESAKAKLIPTDAKKAA